MSGASTPEAPQITAGAVTIASLSAADWPAAARIYDAGIASGNATFEAEAPDWQEWSPQGARAAPTLVARGPHGDVLGWAALTPTSPLRGVSRGGDGEHLRRPGGGRQGVGQRAAGRADRGLRARWLLDARGVHLSGECASIALHEGSGFKLVGTRRRIGQMPDGRWRDERLYERRSERSARLRASRLDAQGARRRRAPSPPRRPVARTAGADGRQDDPQLHRVRLSVRPVARAVPRVRGLEHAGRGTPGRDRRAESPRGRAPARRRHTARGAGPGVAARLVPRPLREVG